MTTAEVVQTLKAEFKEGILEEKTFLGETTCKVRKNILKPILHFLKQMPVPGYEILTDLTGVDFLHPIKHTQVMYLLQNRSNYERLRVTVDVEREGSLPSAIDLWEGVDWYERELFDLFGVQFEGHPDLKRILMPDDWKGHPLRRDYALTEEPVEFKHGVKPKVPSEIIPHDRNLGP